MGEDRPQTEHGPGEARHRDRVTVTEAADILGITAEAVRTRIKRGKLDSIKEPPDRTGTVYVLLDAGQTGPNIDPTSQGQDQTTDQTQRGELVEALREQVGYLQGVIATRDRELALRAEEIRRRDEALEREQQLTAIFADRLRELEAPSEARESPVSPGPSEAPPEAPAGPQTATQSPEAQEPAGRAFRPWYRRIFGQRS
jgi:hypothetical protein